MKECARPGRSNSRGQVCVEPFEGGPRYSVAAPADVRTPLHTTLNKRLHLASAACHFVVPGRARNVFGANLCTAAMIKSSVPSASRVGRS